MLLNLTESNLAEKARVDLRFIRDLEQGKLTLRIDKINQGLFTKIFNRKMHALCYYVF